MIFHARVRAGCGEALRTPRTISKAATSAAKTASARSAAAVKAGAAAAKAGASQAKATAARATSAVKSKAKAAMPTRKKNPALREANGDAAAVRNCNNSFTATTGVLMADGTTKPISAVQPGDTVLAGPPAPADEQQALDESRAKADANPTADRSSGKATGHGAGTGQSAADLPDTARPVARQVTAHITGTGVKQLVDLTLVGAGAGGGGPPSGEPIDSPGTVQQLTATDGHPCGPSTEAGPAPPT